MVDNYESKSDVAIEPSDSQPSSSESHSSVSSVESEPQSSSGKPMNDEQHNVPQRDAGNPPDPTLPTPNESPVQPSAREVAIADMEKPYISYGLRYEPGPIKHNPGAGTVEEGLGEYDTEPNCPDAAYLAGDCERSEDYYKNRGIRTREEILKEREEAAKVSSEPAPSEESK